MKTKLETLSYYTIYTACVVLALAIAPVVGGIFVLDRMKDRVLR